MNTRVITLQYDGTQRSLPISFDGIDPQHFFVFSTVPAAGFPTITPMLGSHSTAGAAIVVPSGWQGTVVVTIFQGFGITEGAPVATKGRATFSASSSAPVVWSASLLDAYYLVVPGKPILTDGGGGVITGVDPTTVDPSRAVVVATSSFTGWVDLLAFQVGAVPFVVGG